MKLNKDFFDKLKRENKIVSPSALIKKNMYDKKNIIYADDLKVYFPVLGGVFKRKLADLKAVDGVSFSIEKGKTLGIVGESGSGKTTLGRCLIKLVEANSGSVIYSKKINGEEALVNITRLTKKEMRPLRSDIQMIFQDPYSSLNPRFTVGDIIEEPMRIHLNHSQKELKEKAFAMLQKVGLAEEHYYRYPHEFSGGQRQRIGIARALSTNPEIIIADEPVSALDVSVQAQVINLMEELQEEFGLTYIFIAHDLSVVKHISDQIAVMYLGKIVEMGDADKVYNEPRHPYTKALLASVPHPDPEKKIKHTPLKGDVPSPINKPNGCPFHPRCPIAKDICRKEEPPVKYFSSSAFTSCHFV